MPEVFISHCSKDKRLVLETADYLSRSLIQVWIDDEQIGGGGKLAEMISSGIGKCSYFMAFISNDYVSSPWCLEELDQAYHHWKNDKLTIIPVLIPNRSGLQLNQIPEQKRSLLESLLERTKYVEFDTYNKPKSIERVADAVWKNESLRFEPIVEKVIDGVRLQVISIMKRTNALPTNYLQTCGLNMAGFIAENENDKKPIRPGIPVAFTGAVPNWLLTYLTIPFKNQRSVFIYNNISNDYICVFSLPSDDLLGRVLSTGL